MMNIYVITFNNAMLVEYQIKTLKRFLVDEYKLIIVDNNNWLHPENSIQVQAICDREHVQYVKAPDNHYQKPEHFDPSKKLGTTMNWVYETLVKKEAPKYFGFLDHDCFLIEKTRMSFGLDPMGMYGRVCRKESGAWNLHTVANFFKYDFIKHYPLNFDVSHEHLLDTGGANYEIVYKHFNHADYELTSVGHRYAEHDVNRKDSVQHYEIMDNRWFHICASTHDQLVGDGAYKLIYAKGFLDSKLINL